MDERICGAYVMEDFPFDLQYIKIVEQLEKNKKISPRSSINSKAGAFVNPAAFDLRNEIPSIILSLFGLTVQESNWQRIMAPAWGDEAYKQLRRKEGIPEESEESEESEEMVKIIKLPEEMLGMLSTLLKNLKR